jgi:hypothetical protein
MTKLKNWNSKSQNQFWIESFQKLTISKSHNCHLNSTIFLLSPYMQKINNIILDNGLCIIERSNFSHAKLVAHSLLYRNKILYGSK